MSNKHYPAGQLSIINYQLKKVLYMTKKNSSLQFFCEKRSVFEKIALFLQIVSII